ncbi:MAG TPA: ABC transporter ATP-binding protein [Polyangiaceae bacterium]
MAVEAPGGAEDTRGAAKARGTPLLTVENVGIAFGGVRALRGVSLTVDQGAIVSVIGPNGAGKTTLFNCITGVYRADTGHVRLAGQDLVGQKPHRIAGMGVARTFQNIELFARMSVLDNLLLGRHRHMRSGALAGMCFLPHVRREEVAQRRRAEEILDFLDLQSSRDRFVSQLPYGVRKMVELARALAVEPRLLLLDEPSAGMNAEEKEDLVHLITDIRDEMHITVVLVEHDMGLVMGISDHVVVLDHGERIAEGSPAEVTQNEDVIRAYLGTDAKAQSALGGATLARAPALGPSEESTRTQESNP